MLRFGTFIETVVLAAFVWGILIAFAGASSAAQCCVGLQGFRRKNCYPIASETITPTNLRGRRGLRARLRYDARLEEITDE
jgi:hypothetical protein